MKCPTILHIANDFPHTKVHKNLYTAIDTLGFHQYVFSPIKQPSDINANHIDFVVSNSKIIYSEILRQYHRVFFRHKIKFLKQQINSKIDLNNITLIHATTLFSDGALAYSLWKEYHIPYIVAVRNTDLNIFFRFRPDLIFKAYKILENAKKIIFISEANKFQFLNHFLIRKRSKKYINKAIVIPNGIADFWLDNRNTVKNSKNNILFIGRFDKNKNVLPLIAAIMKVRKNYNIELGLIGGGGSEHQKVLKIIQQNPWIHYYGKVAERDLQLNIVRNHQIFAMASIHETFGLVYLEALSQGLPILYTKGQGIDGMFKNRIGEAVNPKSIDEIQIGLERLLKNSDQYDFTNLDLSFFSWSKISERYIQLYSALH